MQVEAVELEQPSPTEIAEDCESDQDLLPEGDGARRGGPVKKKEKRKRSEKVKNVGSAQVIQDDEDDSDALDSPSKRPLRGGMFLSLEMRSEPYCSSTCQR